jgi:hypothetical protein
MTQHATALSTMIEKTLSSVLQTARSSLGAWTGERVTVAPLGYGQSSVQRLSQSAGQLAKSQSELPQRAPLSTVAQLQDW